MYGNNWWDTWDIINWEQDSDDRIRYLINRFHLEKVNFNVKYPRHGEYESPLYFAVVASASSDIIELLIKYGADPTLKIKTPWTISRDGCLERYPYNEWTLLHTAAAAYASCGEAADALCKFVPSIINEKDNCGLTALHIAASQGKTEVIRALIKHKADLNARDFEGWTPLHLAAHNGYFKSVSALAKAGADLYAKTKDGDMAIHLAARGEEIEVNPHDELEAYLASRHNHSKVIHALAKQGFDLNAKNDEKETAFFLATSYGNKKTAKALIKEGADINIKNGYGETALEHAINYGHIKTAKVLIKAGAKLRKTYITNKYALGLLEKQRGE